MALCHLYTFLETEIFKLAALVWSGFLKYLAELKNLPNFQIHVLANIGSSAIVVIGCAVAH